VSRLPALLLAPIVLRQAARLRTDVPRLPEAHGAKDGLVHGAFAPSGEGSESVEPAVRALPHPLRLLVLGDSTAMGTGVGVLDDAIPGRLARLLAGTRAGASGVAWRAVGRSGATSAQVLDGFATAAVAVHFDVAVVLVGWNDALRLRPPREFARSLGALLDRLRLGSPDARLLVVAPPEFADFAVLPNPLRWALGFHARGLTRTSARVAREHDAATAPGFDGRTVASDRFHPNAAGYQRLAEGIAAALSPE
jgi:lysophospholipase L1-like esterase